MVPVEKQFELFHLAVADFAHDLFVFHESPYLPIS
jgi:hypothetical protein